MAPGFAPEVPQASDTQSATAGKPPQHQAAPDTPQATTWSADAQKELQKIPFFVRGKARRNTERFAAERGVHTITVETLYDAKAHFGR